MKREHGNGNGHGPSLSIEAQRLLQTPSVADATGGHESRGGDRSDELLLNGQVKALFPTPTTEPDTGNGHARNLGKETRLLPTVRTENNENRQSEGYGGGKDGNFHELVGGQSEWGQYAAAIDRWERVLGRPAPAPTQTSTKGNPQLSPAFTEWMMGVPAGWITGTPGITRNEALKACGNGVVPQQFYALITDCLDTFDALDGTTP